MHPHLHPIFLFQRAPQVGAQHAREHGGTIGIGNQQSQIIKLINQLVTIYLLIG